MINGNGKNILNKFFINQSKINRGTDNLLVQNTIFLSYVSLIIKTEIFNVSLTPIQRVHITRHFSEVFGELVWRTPNSNLKELITIGVWSVWILRR